MDIKTKEKLWFIIFVLLFLMYVMIQTTLFISYLRFDFTKLLSEDFIFQYMVFLGSIFKTMSIILTISNFWINNITFFILIFVLGFTYPEHPKHQEKKVDNNAK